MAAALLLRAMPELSTPEGRRVRQGLRGLWSKLWCRTPRVLHRSPTARDARGNDPLQTGHQQCRVRRPLTRKGATRPHLSTSMSGPTRTSGLPSRPDGVTWTRPSLGAIDRAEAGGTTPTMTAARRRSLRAPASSARPSAGPSSRHDSDSPLTSPSTQGKPTLSSG